jgi:hypothetical protein
VWKFHVLCLGWGVLGSGPSSTRFRVWQFSQELSGSGMAAGAVVLPWLFFCAVHLDGFGVCYMYCVFGAVKVICGIFNHWMSLFLGSVIGITGSDGALQRWMVAGRGAAGLLSDCRSRCSGEVWPWR